MSGVRRRVLGVLVTVVVAGAGLVTAQPAVAAGGVPHEVDVVNLSGTDVNVRFAYSSDGSAGRVSSSDFGGAKKLPQNDVVVASGARGGNYAYDVPANTYDNGFWVNVSRTDDSADRAVAKVYRWKSSSDSPVVTDQAGTSLTITSRYETASNGFSGKKTRLVITEARGYTYTPNTPSRWPYPRSVAWEFDTRIGGDGDGWQPLGDGTHMWRLRNLLPHADYWFRCYSPALGTLNVNGVVPRDRDHGFWAPSDSRGVITVLRAAGSSEGGVCDVHSSPNSISAKRVTGSTTYRGINERPIYRIDLPSRIRDFGTVPPPNQFRVAPYSVQGATATGNWQDLGTVLPVSTPTLFGNSVRYGASTFFFQNAAGQEPIRYVRVSGAYGSWSPATDLAALAAPAASASDLSALQVTRRSVAGLGAAALEANGVSQEALDITLSDSAGNAIATASPLAGIADNVYFRDEHGALITGFYKAAGSSAISAARGSAGAALGGTTTTAYLSTTDAPAGNTWVTAELSLDDTFDNGNDLTFAYYRPKLGLEGSFPAGVAMKRYTAEGSMQLAIASPGIIPPPGSPSPESTLLTYRVGAAGAEATARPSTVIVTRYSTLVDPSALPLPDIQKGLGVIQKGPGVAGLSVQAGTLKPGIDLTPFDGVNVVRVTAITGTGSAVSAPIGVVR